MIATSTRLNTPGPDLAAIDGVHALSDVTGFGLAGHLLEIARGSGCVIRIDWRRVPVLPGARELAAGGNVTGASGRNWAGYGGHVQLPRDFPEVERALLTDPQTSGGLLVTCEPHALESVLASFKRHGFDAAAEIGEVATADDVPRLEVR
jgi:selenide, water dikinase